VGRANMVPEPKVPGSNPPGHAFPLRDFPCASRVLRLAAGYARH
jgi:hypothetical protein